MSRLFGCHNNVDSANIKSTRVGPMVRSRRKISMKKYFQTPFLIKFEESQFNLISSRNLVPFCISFFQNLYIPIITRSKYVDIRYLQLSTFTNLEFRKFTGAFFNHRYVTIESHIHYQSSVRPRAHVDIHARTIYKTK